MPAGTQKEGNPPPSYRAATEDTPSLDLTQRLERKLAQYNASQNIFKRWLFEIVSVTISAFCMGAIIAILVALKDQRLGKWPLGLAFVTALSKVAAAALILPISEAIGQLKWSWFHGTRSKDAFDFEIFDKASRGAWGSFLLLIRTKGKSLAAFGALLTILLLAIDTFFQQVTELPQRWVYHGESLIPRTVRYAPQVGDEFLDGIFASQQTRQPITWVTEAFFTSNGTQPVAFGNGTRPDIPVSCPTSRCVWPAYETLGMCSKCVEVPELLTFACLDTQIDWTSNLNSTKTSYPNGTVCGYFLNATSNNPILMSGYRLGKNGKPEGETLLTRNLPLVTNPLKEHLWGGSIKFKSVRNPIIDALISSSSSRAEVRANVAPVLHECVLTWCLKTIESSYWQGAYDERVLKTFVNETPSAEPLWDAYVWPDDPAYFYAEYLEDIHIEGPADSLNSSRLDWGLGRQTMFDSLLNFDRVFPALTTIAENSSEPLMRWRIGDIKEVRTIRLNFNPWLAPNNITLHMERMVTAITNVMRSLPEGVTYVRGKAYIEETYVEVRWAWLTFPLAMLFLSIAFLVSTMIRTSGHGDSELGNWKTSAMPTLLYGLPKDARQGLAAATDWKTKDHSDPKKVKIKLIPERGWRVSGMSHASPVLPSRSHNRAPPGWL